MDKEVTEKVAAESANRWADVPRWFIVIATLGVYIGLQIGLWVGASRFSDKVWERRMSIITALEFIVFAGIGWAFGREVGRKTADEATKQAEQDRDRAKAAEADEKQKAIEAAQLQAKVNAARATTEGFSSDPTLMATAPGQPDPTMVMRTQILAILDS